MTQQPNMQNRRSFLGCAAVAASAFLHRGRAMGAGGVADPGLRAACELAASGRLGRMPLIEMRVGALPAASLAREEPAGGWDRRGRLALDLGAQIVQSTRDAEPSRHRLVRVSATRSTLRAEHAAGQPGAILMRFDFGGTLLNFELRGRPAGHGNGGFRAVCYGTEGTLIMEAGRWSVHWSASGAGSGGSARDGLRAAPAGSASSRLGAALWRAARLSYRLGREVRFNPSTGSFLEDPAASSLLS
jgi:hypothetical protein